ncbi:nucleotide exchange factor GrpE [Paenibacillus sp. 79R4]|uniref:nucleotide exchange factor GrpE n=1 Tax=Paenibacillus sp. 79R4 TaxID=2212847 RepID=UPI0015B83F3D|nr:nucleotide exchange factor GrpE [Paenibacillus sp. 79R4]NWL86893.1 nucleotide exchange factor GrpE [Paenibacillus sp. 79R4]
MKEQQPVQDATNQEEELNHGVDVNQDQSHEVEGQTAPEAEAVPTDAANEEANVELDNLRAELEEQQQRILRVQADYDNFRRRTLKEKEELAKYASAKLISELLPVIDNFERALGTVSDNEAVVAYSKGVEMIIRQFENVLQSEGLKKMETVGEVFNPEYHQAIMQVDSDEYEAGIVVEEVQSGYLLKDKVLRPAMVKVSG